MEFEAAGGFSSFGMNMDANPVIRNPGSDRIVPVLSSPIGFQSNQMPVSHPNQIGVAIINSSISINQSHLSNEIHGLLNPQYVNVGVGMSSMQPSCPVNDLELNTAMPTTKSALFVPAQKRGPQAQDSVRCCSSASGGNAEAVSHSQSNSGSDEAEDQHATNERKQKRMLSNRESARRSRQRKQQHLDELKAQLSQLREENGQILNRFHIASQNYDQITEENCILRSQALELSHRLQRLQHTMNAQSLAGFSTFGVESGHCNSASLGFESAHFAQTLACSDPLF